MNLVLLALLTQLHAATPDAAGLTVMSDGTTTNLEVTVYEPDNGPRIEPAWVMPQNLQSSSSAGALLAER